MAVRLTSREVAFVGFTILLHLDICALLRLIDGLLRGSTSAQHFASMRSVDQSIKDDVVANVVD